MNTMWYLQSHAVWLKLSNLSIVAALPFVRLAAHEGSLYDGQPLKCQTSTASPAEPGGLPCRLGWAHPKGGLPSLTVLDLWRSAHLRGLGVELLVDLPPRRLPQGRLELL